MTGRILVGTASWTDHDPFYPPGVTGADRLAWYAEHFPYVEIDSSFYRIPPARVTDVWARRTPADFLMDIKAHKTMTFHQREAGRVVPPTEKDLEWFEYALRPLRDSGKLGCVLYQFPPWFTYSPANMDALAEVRERHPKDKVAIEFRHRSWGDPKHWERVADLLAEAKLTYCCVDEPQIGSGTMAPVVAATTPELAMIRLHGRNRHTWYKKVEKAEHRFDYWYAHDELEEIALRVRELAEAAVEVHVSLNTNNSNQGPVNALKLAVILDLPQANPTLLAELEAASEPATASTGASPRASLAPASTPGAWGSGSTSSGAPMNTSSGASSPRTRDAGRVSQDDPDPVLGRFVAMASLSPLPRATVFSNRWKYPLGHTSARALSAHVFRHSRVARPPPTCHRH